MINTLSDNEFRQTMGVVMTDVTDTAEPVVDIWPYVKELVDANMVSAYVFNNNLVEKVYRNDTSTFDHILLPTDEGNVFIVIVAELTKAAIFGHYLLDLVKDYSLE